MRIFSIIVAVLLLVTIDGHLIDDDFIEQCKVKSGDPNIEYKFWISKEQFGQSMGKLDMSSNEIFQMSLLSKDCPSIQNHSKSICNVTEEFLTRYDIYLKEFTVCFDKGDEVLTAINEFLPKTIDILDMMCENEFQLGVDFINNGGVDCFRNNKENFTICSMATTSNLLMKPRFMGDNETEESFKRITACYQDCFEQCGNDRLLEIVTSVLRKWKSTLYFQLNILSRYHPAYNPNSVDESAAQQLYRIHKTAVKLFENDPKYADAVESIKGQLGRFEARLGKDFII